VITSRIAAVVPFVLVTSGYLEAAHDERERGTGGELNAGER
jgi:hypothetical protein